MKPNEVKHEIMRRVFWCEVYLKNTGDHQMTSQTRIALADEALEDYDKRFRILPEAIEPYINTGPK